MDFLQLFPASSQHSPMLFCDYRQMGMLCWSAAEQNQLVLVSALSSPNKQQQSASTTIMPAHLLQQQSVLFKRVSTISLSPALPRNAEFTQMLANRTGSLVALVGKQMLFVVEMDPDFWDRRHIGGLDFEFSVDHLRADYFARCDLVHMTLFMRKYPPSVLKAVWFQQQEDTRALFDRADAAAPTGLLALLYSDNVVRLYDVNSVMDRPVAQLDFNSAMPDRTPSESGDEFGGGYSSGADSRPQSTVGFGYMTQLVSFDFGPLRLATELLPASGNSSSNVPQVALFGSVLALDSNGQLYVGQFPIQSGDVPSSISSPPPTGPLPCHFPPAQPSISSRLLCSAAQLHCIRHSQSQQISAWALASEDGLLVHLVLAQQQKPRDSSSSAAASTAASSEFLSLPLLAPPPFELFALECLEIGGTNGEPLKTTGDGGRAAAAPQFGHAFGTTRARRTAGATMVGSSASAATMVGSSASAATMVGSSASAAASAPPVAKAFRLQNDPAGNGAAAYFAVCAREVYRLEVAPLLAHLMRNCSGANAAAAATAPSPSVVHQLLVFAENSSATISSLASLELKSAESHDDRQHQQQQQMIAALCTKTAPTTMAATGVPSNVKKHSFLATLLNRYFSTASSLIPSPPKPAAQTAPMAQQQQPSLADQVRWILAEGSQQLPTQLPAVNFGDEQQRTTTDNADEEAEELRKLVERTEHLSLVQNAIQNILLTQALPVRGRAIDVAIQRASSLLAAFQSVEQFQAGAQQRLTTTFRQITELKAQILRRQAQFQALQERIRRISQALQPMMFPAPAEERAAIGQLRAMQQRLAECFREIRKLDQRLRNHRQALFNGPNVGGAGGTSISNYSAFSAAHCSSSSSGVGIPAQMYLISKNGRQCNKLREQLAQMQKQLDG